MSKINIVQLNNLSHTYNGRDWAVKDLNFEISKNGVVGLLGSNGAGKSTAMNILCGVLRPTMGTILINGVDMLRDPIAAKKQIGFLPQMAPLYLELTVDEYLTYAANLRLVQKNEISRALTNAKQICGLTKVSNRLIRNLSGGYRQRVGIAQAIIHRPVLVVLDEPTNGLDPNQILEVRSLIKSIGEDKAVIFSSHILSEVEATCSNIIMIENGKMVFSDTMTAFNNHIIPNSILIRCLNSPVEKELKGIFGVISVEYLPENRIRIRSLAPEQTAEHIVQASVKHNWQLMEIGLEKSSAEEIFARLSDRH